MDCNGSLGKSGWHNILEEDADKICAKLIGLDATSRLPTTFEAQEFQYKRDSLSGRDIVASQTFNLPLILALPSF